MPSTVAFVQPKQPTAVIAPESRRDAPIDAKEFKAFGEDGLTFEDVLDVINPLHHLPVVGFIYRSITGDTISPASRVADTVLEEASGKDAGSHLLALVDDLREAPAQPGEPREARWSATASLRHDANEYDDEFNETGIKGTDVAAEESLVEGHKS
jgi:hypothetical protein